MLSKSGMVTTDVKPWVPYHPRLVVCFFAIESSPLTGNICDVPSEPVGPLKTVNLNPDELRTIFQCFWNTPITIVISSTCATSTPWSLRDGSLLQCTFLARHEDAVDGVPLALDSKQFLALPPKRYILVMVELNHGDGGTKSESMLYLTLSMRSDLNSWDRLYYEFACIAANSLDECSRYINISCVGVINLTLHLKVLGWKILKTHRGKKKYPKKSFALLQTIFVVPKNKYVVPIFWIYMKKKT